MNPTSAITNLEELQNRLREAEETLAAIRNGEIDSLVVVPSGESKAQVFSLAGAEQPYRVFVEQMQQGAITMASDGTILYVNRRMAELLDVPLEKIIGAHLTDFTEKTDHSHILEALADPHGQRLEFVMRAGDLCGKEHIPSVPVSFALSILPLDGVLGICAVVTDLTEYEQKRELASTLGRLTIAQEQLREQNQELQEARRQAEYAQHAAEEAQHAAEHASDAKDEFLATLSHELRTPLTPVLVAAQALEGEPNLPPHVIADLAMIRRNIELEARLIDDLLDLTRIVRGKVELRITEIDLRRVAANVVEICATDLAEAQVNLVREFGDAPLLVKGDPVRVQQILWNLVRNAIKFTPPGGTVTLNLRVDSDSIAVVEVMDTGIGMNADTIDRIFSPFEQAGREITRRFGGLGLGLAISRKLAEMQQGTIKAASPGQGKGSVFTLILPLVISTPPAAPPTSLSSPARPALRRLRIVLVEDHDDTRKSMTRFLSMEHEVRAAATVADALESASAGPFDLIISDLGLPDGTGLELMKEIRRRHGENIRGICLSGYGMDTDIANSKEAGFNRHLTKPVSLASLKAAIAEALPL